MFEGGDYCHKHPARSLRVILECDTEERAWGASEPSTCAYTVYASTPAACKSDTLKELEVRVCFVSPQAVLWITLGGGGKRLSRRAEFGA